MPRGVLCSAWIGILALCPIWAVAQPGTALGSTSSGASSVPASDAASAAAPSASDAASFDVNKLFANVCGWCHSDAGRTAGKGPQLMGTKLTDPEILYRIRNGKSGAMPAFGKVFDDDQLRIIIAYIRNLKPQGAPP